MVPQTRKRTARNSSKVNLLISLTFHGLIVALGLYLAARGGLLGKQMKKIAVEMVKEKPPEKPKEPEKPKPEPPKVETPKPTPKVETPKMVEAPKVTAPPATMAPPAVAPPAADLPAFEFAGGKTVETSSNPIEIYRGLLQYAFTSRWDKPENIDDAHFVAEVRVAIGPDGRISHPEWLKGSGNPRWDASVREAVAALTKMERPPPTNFPPHFIVRFDVQELATAPID
jgi:hypothetical protein